MAAALGAVIHNLRRSLNRGESARASDGELLERFVARRDADAFEALLRRHGPMVLGVCRRVLENDADADDAFQATFLVLVRKAAAVRPRGMVGNWLYGVAHTTALKARAMNTKRRTRERAAAGQRPVATLDGTWNDLQSVLDQELRGLPDAYRGAIILCDLEGQSIKDAAKRLGCPTGTVGTRLARGRRLLATRLARRGVELTGATLGAMIADHTATAGVPPPLFHSTLKVAALVAAGEAAAGVVPAKVAALTEGVLQAMFLSKLKTTSAVFVLVAAMGVGLGTVGDGPLASAQDKPGTRPWTTEFDPGRPSTGRPQSGRRPAGFEPAGAARAKPADEEALKKASVNGKYSILLKKIEVKEDRGAYHDFYDFGEWNGTSYAGHDDLPAGWWVYVYPHWYIWKENREAGPADQKKAAVDGKYSVLLRKFESKEDHQQYGDFYDYGYWAGTAYLSHMDLPPGYWVYVAPNWFIWGASKDSAKAGPAHDVPLERPPAAKEKPAGKKPAKGEPEKSSVNGKYSRLLKVIEVPSDKDNYGGFNDYGYSPAQDYAGQTNIPAGYWVYVAPNWYVWGDVKEKE
jgi:RNA polymerase sigma factor (sigma-70 family)